MDWPEITKDTPQTEVKRIHQLIWNYVIEHGKKPFTPYVNDCVLCVYAQNTIPHRVHYIETLCRFCPASWTENIACPYDESLFNRWNKTRDPELAKQIRDIPFKYELEEKQNV